MDVGGPAGADDERPGLEDDVEHLVVLDVHLRFATSTFSCLLISSDTEEYKEYRAREGLSPITTLDPSFCLAVLLLLT